MSALSDLDEASLLAWLDEALAGNDRALESLLLALQHPVYRLALRVLGRTADAEDATQEILIKTATALAGFERHSRLSTWVWRIALNHLNDVAALRTRHDAALSLDALAERLDAGAALALPQLLDESADPRLALEARETGLRCTQAMLMCLDVDQRIALVLADVFGVDAREAALLCGVADAAYRQRLSRARQRMGSFLQGRCGLVDGGAPCSCGHQARVKRAMAARPGGVAGADMSGEAVIVWARDDRPDQARTAALVAARDELSLMQRLAVVYRGSPEWHSPPAVAARMRAVIDASRLLGGRGVGGDDAGAASVH